MPVQCSGNQEQDCPLLSAATPHPVPMRGKYFLRPCTPCNRVCMDRLRRPCVCLAWPCRADLHCPGLAWCMIVPPDAYMFSAFLRNLVFREVDGCSFFSAFCIQRQDGRCRQTDESKPCGLVLATDGFVCTGVAAPLLRMHCCMTCVTQLKRTAPRLTACVCIQQGRHSTPGR